MSSEEEATAANVLSQMSQIQQISPCETIETSVVVGHHCDVETTNTQEAQSEATVEVTAEVLQQVQAAFQQQQQVQAAFQQQELPTMTSTSYAEVSKSDHPDHVIADGMYPKTGKSYTCDHCGKKFNKSYNLKTHIRVHTGERPYQCEVCGHGFANLGDLKRHSRTHTGEKPFKCEYCGKVFSDFGSHKRHLRLHTGYKPFKCEQCDREFTRLDSYKNHIRLHTGDRPYKCDTCGKEFNYLTTYKRHLNIHKGEKPYACDQCDKKFTRQNYLKNHLNTHSKISNNECQTDVTVLITTGSPQGSVDAEDQEELETSEGRTAANNLTKVEPHSEDEAEGSSVEGNAKAVIIDSESPSKSPETKPHDTSILQQVTQVLGEIIPHNVSAEVTDGAAGPQIVVQGADQTGGEFKVAVLARNSRFCKITLAQQLLIAQHLLNQAQMQQAGPQGTGDGTQTGSQVSDQPGITAVTIPDISPELAEQILNQATIQQVNQAQDDIRVIELPSRDTATQQQQIVVNGQIVTQGQRAGVMQSSGAQSHGTITEQVLEESGIAVTTYDGTALVGGDAVYVAIDPSQPHVQQFLGQIHVVRDSDSVTVTQADKSA